MKRRRFDKDDPLKYLHVSRRKREAVDGGKGSDAITEGGADDDDLDRYKPGGDLYSDKVVGPEELE